MNKEIIKAINKTEKKAKKTAKKTYFSLNTLQKILVFPLKMCDTIRHKIHTKRYAKIVWDEKRVDEILNYFIPRRASWDKENKEFDFCYNSCVWTISKTLKLVKRKRQKILEQI